MRYHTDLSRPCRGRSDQSRVEQAVDTKVCPATSLHRADRVRRRVDLSAPGNTGISLMVASRGHGLRSVCPEDGIVCIDLAAFRPPATQVMTRANKRA